MLHDIMVTIDRWSVNSLSRCVDTIDQVELDSQHAPSSSRRVGFERYPKFTSIRVDSHYPKSALASIMRSCEVRALACVMLCCGVAEYAHYEKFL